MRFLADLRRIGRFRWRAWRKPGRVCISGVEIELPTDLPQGLRDVFYRGTYEAAEARIVEQTLEPEDVVMEVGGGLGFISTLCALRVGSDRVHCYEANPAMIPHIRRTYELNGVSPRLINAVAGTAPGTRRFYVEDSFDGSSVHRRSRQARARELPAIDLAEEIAEIRPTFLILDIEGAEAELVPHLDLSDVQKIALELHERVIGREAVRRVRARLTEQGFSLDPRLSAYEDLFFERL